MALQLSIRDHEELQAAVLRASLAGGVYGLLAWRFPGVTANVLGVLAIGLAAVPPKSWRSAALASTIALLAGLVSALPGPLGTLAFAAVGGLTFAREASGGGRQLVAALAGALGLGTGWFVASTIGDSGALAAIPPGLAALALGGAAGFVASLGVTGRELAFAPAVEARALPAAATGSGTALAPTSGAAVTAAGDAAGREVTRRDSRGEIDELIDRAETAFAEADKALGDEAPEVRVAAADLLGRISRFGRRWAELDIEARRTDRLALAGRLDDVGAREAAATDDVVRAEYGRARAAMKAQLDYLDGIERGRARAIARLYHHIAVMERLRLAALHHRSADAARVGDELAPLVEDLTAAGRELDTAAEILAELPALSALA